MIAFVVQIAFRANDEIHKLGNILKINIKYKKSRTFNAKAAYSCKHHRLASVFGIGE